MTFLFANALGLAAGIVLKILVPLPFLDQPVKDAYAWVYAKVTGK